MSNSKTPGLNLLTDSIATLTSTSETNHFQVSLVTDDATTAQVIHQRIQQLIYNLGDSVQIDCGWTRTQSKHLENGVF